MDFTLSLTLAGQLSTKCISTWHGNTWHLSVCGVPYSWRPNNLFWCQPKKQKGTKSQDEVVPKASMGTRPHAHTPLHSEKYLFAVKINKHAYTQKEQVQIFISAAPYCCDCFDVLFCLCCPLCQQDKLQLVKICHIDLSLFFFKMK